MFYKHFRVQIFIRVAVIVATAVVFAFMVQERMLFVPLATFLLLVAVVINLIRYIERSNKNLAHLLLSIRQGAYTESYRSGGRGTMFDELSDALNEVIGEFARLHVEKELHYQYLQALNENISVAILSFDSESKLQMMNPSAKRLLAPHQLNNVEDFKRIDINLYQTIRHIRPEERKVVRVLIGEEHYQLNVQVKELMLERKSVRIILLQNLNQELEANEIEAWHQLMSVLTHEIMNSVTPLLSLTSAIQNILQSPVGVRKDLSALEGEDVEDIYSSLNTISSRSKGLLAFVNAYKEYAKPLELKVQSADVVALVERIRELLSTDLDQHRIKSTFSFQNEVMEAEMDIALMEQVIINLLKNAVDAVAHDGTGVITIDVRRKATQQMALSISDNGGGMDSETLRKIFIPFFTTKTKGTGIGLSLSRQIVKMHNGNILVKSELGKGSEFTVEWR